MFKKLTILKIIYYRKGYKTMNIVGGECVMEIRWW